MDIAALELSLWLAACTLVVLIPLALFLGRWLATTDRRRSALAVETLVALPLVLPPTVLGYYLLVGFGRGSVLGRWAEVWLGHSLVFHFSGLLLASIIVNLPFAVQPIQRAFESIPVAITDAAACCGLSPGTQLWHIELPLVRGGILSASVLTFAHTLGEFGVVLMVGGNLPGSTRTLAIAIYDRVQVYDLEAAAQMSAVLLGLSIVAVWLAFRRPRVHPRKRKWRDT